MPESLREKARKWLSLALGDPKAEFRPGQWEAIEEVVHRRGRMLVVQRTGWGKSLVYFLATRILRDQGLGPTLLVSPLLALMRNQLEAAGRLKVRAATINSSNQKDWGPIIQELQEGQIDLLMISPERLANEGFVTRVLMPLAHSVGALVIDEAHCISDWGHDFRPDYRRIVRVMRYLPRSVPVLCTTATANQRVLDDLTSQLGELKVQRGPLTRLSLKLQTLRLEEPATRLAWLAERLDDLPGSGIIYALTQTDTETIADWLQSLGYPVAAYHAGLESQLRVDREQALLASQVKALVATTALGMGFDKPDLGFVVHYQAPPSLIHYYQQVGRAGRALPEALGILMSGPEELQVAEYFRRTAFPRQEWVEQILLLLEQNEDGLHRRELEGALNLRSGQIDQVLRLLAVEDPPPVVTDKSVWKRTVHPYSLDSERIHRLSSQRKGESDEVQSLVHSKTCLMERLQRALEDPTAQSCGRCAPCLGQPLLPEGVTPAVEDAARLFLDEHDLVLSPRKQFLVDLPGYGWRRGRIPVALQVQEGRILSRWSRGRGDLGALLRSAGAGPVYPLALATSAPGESS